MSFHDKAAIKAAKMGKKPPEFRIAAQKHANATWFFIIGAGAVWFFWAWQFAILPALISIFTAIQSISSTMIAEKLSKLESVKQAESMRATDDVFTVIGEYGEIMEKSAPAPGCAADVKKLPYPKHVIKAALIKALKSTSDHQLKEHLKTGYIFLSRWQEGVGEKDQGIDLSKIDRNQSAEDIARAMLLAEQAADGKDWNKIILDEQKTLMQELKTLGFSS